MRFARERHIVLSGLARKIGAVEDAVLVFEEKSPDLIALGHRLALQVHQAGREIDRGGRVSPEEIRHPVDVPFERRQVHANEL